MIKPCKPAQKIIKDEFSQYAGNEVNQEDFIHAIYNYVINHYYAIEMLSKKEQLVFLKLMTLPVLMRFIHLIILEAHQISQNLEFMGIIMF